MKKHTIICDLCDKEIKPEEFHEYALLKRGWFLVNTEEVLDICENCIETFKEISVKRRNKKCQEKKK